MKRFTGILIAITFMTMTFNHFQTNADAKQASGELREREEINRSFTLSPGAHVNISNVSGPVEIRTSEGNTAEVHIVRMARNREDFQLRKFVIEQTPTGLVVRGDNERQGRASRGLQINEQVVLELPRQIELTISSISGPITSGGITGPLQASSISGPLTIGSVGDAVKLSSISGPVRVGLVTGHLSASSVSGSLSATVDRLDGRGIQLMSISGPVELRFQDKLNADLDVTNVSGKVYVDVPNAAFEGASDSSNRKARIGSGGSPISISSVSGNVRLGHK
jgi:DUF4097 and DUF4098 domain-containing protein YvlB